MSRKLTRAPTWQRLLGTKLSVRKAMATLRLPLTQDRSMENTLGKRTPGQEDRQR